MLLAKKLLLLSFLLWNLCLDGGYGQVDTWIVPSTQQVFEESRKSLHQHSDAISWAAQRGEAEHSQLAIRSSQRVTGVRVAFSGAISPWLSAKQVGQVFPIVTPTGTPTPCIIGRFFATRLS